MTAVKALVFALLCAPALAAALRLPSAVDPAAALTHTTGEWALRILLITLAITPLRHLTGINKLARLRRMCGLFVFAYAAGHFSVYLLLDLQLDFSLLAEDIIERKYITVGFAAFVLLVPLAATSADWCARKLGGKKWQTLHRLVYVIGILAILHYLWLKKGDDWGGAAAHGAILAFLLFCRLPVMRGRLAKIAGKLNKARR
ncbi:MAG: sulfite oxidase heme-binding subunit YedZ [Gammaproteobacteria bacterium]